MSQLRGLTGRDQGSCSVCRWASFLSTQTVLRSSHAPTPPPTTHPHEGPVSFSPGHWPRSMKTRKHLPAPPGAKAISRREVTAERGLFAAQHCPGQRLGRRGGGAGTAGTAQLWSPAQVTCPLGLSSLVYEMRQMGHRPGCREDWSRAARQTGKLKSQRGTVVAPAHQRPIPATRGGPSTRHQLPRCYTLWGLGQFLSGFKPFYSMQVKKQKKPQKPRNLPSPHLPFKLLGSGSPASWKLRHLCPSALPTGPPQGQGSQASPVCPQHQPGPQQVCAGTAPLLRIPAQTSPVLPQEEVAANTVTWTSPLPNWEHPHGLDTCLPACPLSPPLERELQEQPPDTSCPRLHALPLPCTQEAALN